MKHYIDGFVLPIPRKHLERYQKVAEKISDVWKEYGALSYREYVGDAMTLEGTRSFIDATTAKEHEVVIFGWVEFESKEARDIANAKVPLDPRMKDIVAPLLDADDLVFNAERMVYGGFKPIVM